MLYVIATPIGNLGDITYRAIETIKACDYLLCEDTRHSVILLKHYDLQVPLKSFHKFSESAKQDQIIEDLRQGMIIGLISDAGTPGISDPGTQLIHACIDQNISVIAIPGACAAITALCCSGLNTDNFQFIGFLPRKSGELKKVLQGILAYTGTSICYESPNRLTDVLEVLHELSPKRKLVVARELTKRFEEIKRGVAQELIEYWKTAPLKGEIVLLVEGEKENISLEMENLTPEEHVALMQSTYGLSRKEAIYVVAKMRNVSKRDIYNIVNTL